jgi:hypothetical protein
MTLENMPDFQVPLSEKGVTVFAPFSGQGPYTLLPAALGIATREDGSKDFHLGIVRPENPMLPPVPYGTLDFRLQAVFAMEEGLALVRSHQPGSVLEQALFRDGFVQLSPIGEQLKDAAPQLFAPVSINFQGLGVARYFSRLDLASALLVKNMLASNAAPLRATAFLEVWGVAPRLPLKISLDPAVFLGYLLSKAGPGRRISRAGLVSVFTTASGQTPWKVEGSLVQIEPRVFGECMADHVRARFASLAAPLAGESEPMLVLPEADAFGSGTFSWDLNEPVSTARAITLTFDPLAEARDLVSSKGLDAVVSMDTVRRLQTGVTSLAVTANLPSQRQGVLSLGVTIKVPPKLPFRPQQINRTLELQEPHDSGSVEVQLSPKEKLAFTCQTFVILQDSAGIQRLEGEDTPHSSDKLDLNMDDFPLSFVSVGSTDRLLAAGSVSGVVSHDGVQSTFSLTASQPMLTLAVPRNSDATVEFEFRSPDGAHVLKLGPAPAQATHLDLSSFREYGPQTLDIRCTFHTDSPLLAIDLLPESSPENAASIMVLALTPQTPQRQWSWFAASPFASGYRYRLHKAEAPANSWSEVRSPFEPLLLDSGAASQSAGAGSQS